MKYEEKDGGKDEEKIRELNGRKFITSFIIWDFRSYE